jgi:hypothetical protein
MSGLDYLAWDVPTGRMTRESTGPPGRNGAIQKVRFTPPDAGRLVALSAMDSPSAGGGNSG